MKAQKIKRYRLGVSRTFPSTHPRKGQPTYFVEKITLALGMLVHLPGDILIDIDPKIHTCRANYPLWEKRMKEVQTGNAVIELFYWSGKPRNKGSQQVVFATLDKDSGCGIQLVKFGFNSLECPFIGDSKSITLSEGIGILNQITKNDGLSLQDFKDWFKSYDLSEPMAVLHFTSFRY